MIGFSAETGVAGCRIPAAGKGDKTVIRLARKEELPRLLEIYAAARVFMRQNGNAEQWAGGYPGEVLCRPVTMFSPRLLMRPLGLPSTKHRVSTASVSGIR